MSRGRPPIQTLGIFFDAINPELCQLQVSYRRTGGLLGEPEAFFMLVIANDHGDPESFIRLSEASAHALRQVLAAASPGEPAP
jgi:hypothetical protein